MKKFLFVSMILASNIAHAGHETGNGGDAVVCRDASRRIVSAELLDFYEARVQRGIVPELGGPELSVEQKVEYALTRLARLSPLRAARYREWARGILEKREALYLSGVQLVDIPDSGHLAMPSGCAVEQVAIQAEPKFPEDKRYTIADDLYQAMDPTSRAGLVLHEVIYREAISHLHGDSTRARYFNAVVSSNRMASLDLAGFVELVRIAEMSTVELYGLEMDQEMVTFHANGQLKSVNFGTNVVGQPAFFKMSLPVFHDEVGVHQLRFYPDGSVESARISGKARVRAPGVEGQVAGRIEFASDGHLALASVNQFRFLRDDEWVTVRTSERTSEDYAPVSFYPGTSIPGGDRWVYAVERMTLPGIDGRNYLFEPGSRLMFDSQGRYASQPLGTFRAKCRVLEDFMYDEVQLDHDPSRTGRDASILYLRNGLVVDTHDKGYDLEVSGAQIQGGHKYGTWIRIWKNKPRQEGLAGKAKIRDKQVDLVCKLEGQIP